MHMPTKLKSIEIKQGGKWQAVAKADDTSYLLKAEGLTSPEVLAVVNEGGYQHVVQKNAPYAELELNLANIMSESPGVYLADPVGSIVGRPFGSEDMLCLKVECLIDEKKVRMLYQFESFLKAVPGTKTIRETALLIADELYTNASRNGTRGGTHRDGTITFYACVENKRLVFGCVDSFGELSVSRLLGRIATCFDQGVAESIQKGSGGAGIGSYMVFSRAMSYYIGVEMGHKTTLMVSLPLGIRTDSALELPKNLHVVTI
jgi:hypothetical protein